MIQHVAKGKRVSPKKLAFGAVAPPGRVDIRRHFVVAGLVIVCDISLRRHLQGWGLR